MRARIDIGIDPGVSTGYAAWDRGEQQFLTIETLKFFSALDAIGDLHDAYKDDLLVHVEDPSLIKPTFRRKGTNEAVMRNISQKVGMNKAHAMLMIERLRQLGIRVQPVRPKHKKWTRETFTRMTGIDRKYSQHAIDAARLIFGL